MPFKPDELKSKTDEELGSALTQLHADIGQKYCECEDADLALRTVATELANKRIERSQIQAEQKARLSAPSGSGAGISASPTP